MALVTLFVDHLDRQLRFARAPHTDQDSRSPDQDVFMNPTFGICVMNGGGLYSKDPLGLGGVFRSLNKTLVSEQLPTVRDLKSAGVHTCSPGTSCGEGVEHGGPKPAVRGRPEAVRGACRSLALSYPRRRGKGFGQALACVDRSIISLYIF